MRRIALLLTTAFLLALTTTAVSAGEYPTSSTTVAENTTSTTVEETTTTTVAPTTSTTVAELPTCDELPVDLTPADPEFRPDLDADSDGVACERPAPPSTAPPAVPQVRQPQFTG